MLIGICGAADEAIGICAGKKTVAQYLIDHHGFTHIYLDTPAQRPSTATSTVAPTTTANAHNYDSSSSDGSDDEPLPDLAPKALVNGKPSSSSRPDLLTFSSTQSLLDYVTPRWRSRYVLTDIHSESHLDLLARRPFFLLVSVDAPITLRWRRYQQVKSALALPSPFGPADQPGQPLPDLPDLESFVTHSDSRLYDPHSGLQPLISRATVRLLNTSPSLPHLYATLAKLDLPSPARLRPSWDAYFMSLATLASLRSNCMKRRVGCVLVSGAQRRVLSTGYNGTPRGLRNCAEGGCPRCNDGGASSGGGLATCLCIHAEENALLEAGRERIRDGAVLYCDTCPCLTCSIKICQVGIREVVYAQGYSMDTETAAVFSEAGVKLRQFVPPPNGLIQLENVEKMDLY